MLIDPTVELPESRDPIEDECVDVCLRRMKTNNRKCFVAGGVIRSVISGEDTSDIDLFATSKEEAKALHESLGGTDVWSSDNAYTSTVGCFVVQVIHRWSFSTMAECIESFDFTTGLHEPVEER